MATSTKPEETNTDTAPETPWVVVRGRDSGAFFGRLVHREGQAVELHDTRRIWYWDGAASLSELAKYGVAQPDNCKFPEAVRSHLVLDAIEVILATEDAVASIEQVPIWTAR